jgi:glyoxylase-like metal-dependent hydrolase (beta-lactamase superfamily II)
MAFFRQIPDDSGQGFAYLLADLDKREAVIIDPAESQTMLYQALLAEIQVRLVRILVTHCHDGTAPGAARLQQRTSAPVSAGIDSRLSPNLQPLVDGTAIPFGDEILVARSTPGHTRGCVSYLWRDRVFTGDALLIDDCGTSNDGEGDAGSLFDSLGKLLTLPDETLVYPAHSSEGRQVSNIGEQRRRNPRLAGVSRDEFIAAQERRPAMVAIPPPSFPTSPSFVLSRRNPS